MVDIVEHLAEWQAHYAANFAQSVADTGETNFKIYEYVRNEEVPSGPAIQVSTSRVLFVTSSGAYLKNAQTPFDAPNLLGDYTLRTFPLATPLDETAFAHDHYDHQYVDQDAQVLVPLRHLEALVAEGFVGEVAPQIVSFSGYMPDVGRVVNDVIPQVVAVAKEQAVDAALLVPV